VIYHIEYFGGHYLADITKFINLIWSLLFMIIMPYIVEAYLKFIILLYL